MTEDYELFLTAVHDASMRHPTDVHGYSLMDNHVHLVMTPRSPDALERLMQSVGVRYVQYFNRKYSRTGTLFDGRYRPTIIDSAVYWFRCMRYVELNPVRAGLVSAPEAYRWSSYAANAFGAPDRLITRHPLYDGLGATLEERQQRWREICVEADFHQELTTLRRAVHRGGALGPIILPHPAAGT